MSRILALVVACLILHSLPPLAAGQCPCDTSTSVKNALLDLRTSIAATGWSLSQSTCTWSGVTCTANNGLTALDLCGDSSCSGNGMLPDNAATWNSIGQSLTSMTINNNLFKLSSSATFPLTASKGLTNLRSLRFYYFSPAGNFTFPVGSSSGYSMVLDSSTLSSLSVFGISAAQMTSVTISYSAIPDLSGCTSLQSATVVGGTVDDVLSTLGWTSMTSITSVVLSTLSFTLPSWTGANFPKLSTISLVSLRMTSLPSSWGSITSITSISIFSGSFSSTLPSSWSSLFNLNAVIMSNSVTMTGPLPSSWGSLPAITSISLVFVTFVGGSTLPSEWGQMPLLTSLVISQCGLSGTIPVWSSASSQLALLNLQGNSFTGPLPENPVGWSKLTTLTLSDNIFQSTLPLWAPLSSSLVTFICNLCYLTGPLPPWGSSRSPMSSLQVITLTGNNIASSIPSSWGLMPALTDLVAPTAQIVGQLPLTWVSPQLRTLGVSGGNNQLSGNISGLTIASNVFYTLDLGSHLIGPGCLFTLPAGLRTLLLNKNVCSGPHPMWASATSLTVINLQSNQFSGSLIGVSSLTALQVLRIDLGNIFSGSLPNWGALAALVEFSASSNAFSGSVPAFHPQANLQIFQVDNNLLVGSFPSISASTNLQTLNLALNAFTGAMPPLPSPRLLVLNLMVNQFQGPLPDLAAASSIQQVNVSFNNFNGTLSLSTSLSGLQLFDVACNSLTGTLPAWSACSTLMYVNLTCGNTFTGTVPPLHALTYASLKRLDFTDQKLTGTLPAILGTYFYTPSYWPSIGVQSMLLGGGNRITGSIVTFLAWRSLQRLNFSGNNLSGVVVMSGATLPSNLWSLDISHNNVLSGNVPAPSVGSMPQMRHFLLGGDAHTFSGVLPSLHSIFPGLVRLSLSGSFPVTIPYAWLVGSAAWVNLTTLSLRKCGFSGTFPSPLASTQLTLLDLSRNQLAGSLPADLSSYAPLLTFLSLGENLFDGQVPATWSSLSRLMHLAVNSCQLSGTLPITLATLGPTLQVLLLYGNNFASSPSTDDLFWASLVNLRRLDISSNNFTIIPYLPETLSKLTSLNISVNPLNTVLPVQYSTNISQLVVLNASRCGFMGTVPFAWSNFTKLLTLDLSDNLLSDDSTSGSSSSSLSLQHMLDNATSFPSLQSLNLRGNVFNSTLDPSSYIGPMLVNLDISFNGLVGGLFFNLLLNATSLQTLQLQHNVLNSTLPKGWAISQVVSTSTVLQLVNLSGNELYGPLPYNWRSVFSRRSLTLDLCGNQLCGPVPMVLRSGISSYGLDRCAGSGSLRTDVPCYTDSMTFTSSSSVTHEITGPTESATDPLSQTDTIIPSITPTMTNPQTMSLDSHSPTAASSSTLTTSRSPRTAVVSASVTQSDATITFNLSSSRSPPTKSRSTSRATRSLPVTMSPPKDTATITCSNQSTPSSTYTATIRLPRTPSASLAVTFTRPTGTPSTTQTRHSVTQEQSNSPTVTPSPTLTATPSFSASRQTYTHRVSDSSTKTPTMATATRFWTISHSSSYWDCTAVNDSEIWIGLGNVSAGLLDNSTRFVVATPVDAPAHPARISSSSREQSHAISKAIVTTAQPIDRHQLMDAPTALVLNITVDSPFASYWSVTNVTLAGQLLATSSIKAVTGRWHLITLHPPDINGWVGAGGLPLYFVDRVVVLEVVMACGSSPILSVSLTINTPGIPREFSDNVATAAQSAQILSVFASGVTAGAALARALILRSTVMCDAYAAASNGVIDFNFDI
ncbi:GP46-like surface antigen, putative, partial [Bodo saltans]